jgi:hypothetical protein
LHRRVKKSIAKDGQQERDAERQEGWKYRYQSHTRCEQQNARQHSKPAPALIGNRS